VLKHWFLEDSLFSFGVIAMSHFSKIHIPVATKMQNLIREKVLFLADVLCAMGKRPQNISKIALLPNCNKVI